MSIISYVTIGYNFLFYALWLYNIEFETVKTLGGKYGRKNINSDLNMGPHILIAQC